VCVCVCVLCKLTHPDVVCVYDTTRTSKRVHNDFAKFLKMKFFIFCEKNNFAAGRGVCCAS